MRGVGKNWWNSTGFVAGVIDVGLIVLGLGLANSSVNTVKAIIRKNKRNIARVTENVIVAQIGITTVRKSARRCRNRLSFSWYFGWRSNRRRP